MSRFLIDDRREVYYRVEVQNRVYRREISILDNEISKLEKALSSDPSIASSSHSSVVSRKVGIFVINLIGNDYVSRIPTTIQFDKTGNIVTPGNVMCIRNAM